MDLQPAPSRTEVTRARARAEAAEWAWMLDRHDAAVDAIGTDSAWQRSCEVDAIRLDIARDTGWSEHQTRVRLQAARTLRDAMPRCWEAFTAGDLDALRALVITDAAHDLVDAGSVTRFDERAAAYAATHTSTELRRWARLTIARLEPVEATERAERARETRRVSVEHVGDSMAWVNAFVPSIVAAALDQRLDREARRLDSDATIEQRRADLFAAWLTTGESTSASPTIDVGVLVPVEALGRDSFLHATSPDGGWTVPVGWLKELARTGDTFWHRMVMSPAGRLLDHTYLGRFAPDVLRRAIDLRDGTCRVPGCAVPAGRCDKDHRVPWPVGPTSGRNLRCLCRRHHRLKGQGLIDVPG